MLKISPSSLHRAIKCTASPRESEGIVEPPNIYAAKGTHAHECVLPAFAANNPGMVLDLVDPNKAKLEDAEEWEDWAEQLCVWLNANQGENARPNIHIERQFPGLTSLGMEATGREGEWQADAVWEDPEHPGIWHVLDLKSGTGDVPHAEANHQLAAYAWALLTEEGVKGMGDGVHTHIYQPRSKEPGKRFTHGWWSRERLEAWAHIVTQEVMPAVREGGSYQVGEWCAWCPARSTCPAKNEQAQDKRDTRDLTKAAGSTAIKGGAMQTVSVPQELGGVELTVMGEEAVKRAEDLQAQASRLSVVTNDEMAQDAGDLLGQITKFEKQVDERRAEVKAPVIALGKAIDERAKEALAPLGQAKASLKAALGGYIEKIERARREEEARQKAEQDRLTREREEAERKAASAKSAKARAEAEAKAAELRKQEAQASLIPAPTPTVKPSGVATEQKFTFTVLDAASAPPRYLVHESMPLKMDRAGDFCITSLDGKLMAADAKAGKLKTCAWVTVHETTAVKAGR